MQADQDKILEIKKIRREFDRTLAHIKKHFDALIHNANQRQAEAFLEDIRKRLQP